MKQQMYGRAQIQDKVRGFILYADRFFQVTLLLTRQAIAIGAILLNLLPWYPGYWLLMNVQHSGQIPIVLVFYPILVRILFPATWVITTHLIGSAWDAIVRWASSR